MSLGILPKDWKADHVMPIYKNKRSKSDPGITASLRFLLSSERSSILLLVPISLISWFKISSYLPVNLAFYQITPPVTNICFCFINVLLLINRKRCPNSAWIYEASNGKQRWGNILILKWREKYTNKNTTY